MRVALLRPKEYLEESANLLASAGFEVIAAPFLKITRDEKGIDRLRSISDFDAAIVTSQSAARMLAGCSAILRGKRVIAIGNKTAEVLLENGIKAETPKKFDSKTLFQEFSDGLKGARVLILRSDKGDPAMLKLAEIADIEEIVLYKIEYEWGEEQKELLRLVAGKAIDAVVFSSSMTVRSFIELAKSMELLEEIRVALNNIHTIAIGPPTRSMLWKYGINAKMPAEYTFNGVVNLLATLKNSLLQQNK